MLLNKSRAKRMKIEDLFEGELHRVGSEKLSGLCPFHKDSDKKNPNFIIYTNTNTWFCWVCRKGGDSIAFYMKLKNLGFVDAVKEMLKK